MGYLLAVIVLALIFSNDSAGVVVSATNSLTTADLIAGLDIHATVLMNCDAYNYLQSIPYVGKFDPEHIETLIQALNQIKTLPPQYQELLINLITSIKTNAILNEILTTTKEQPSLDDAVTTFFSEKDIIVKQVEDMSTAAAKTGIMKYAVTILATTVITGLILTSFLYN